MNHEKFIEECFIEAQKGLGNVGPNPLVGAVLASKNGEIVARGAHLKYGENHAEVNCINSFSGDFSNLTLYVSLEPCSHKGKTPPCVDLIIKKGIKKVVYALDDPNPKVEGKNILQKAGVEVISGVLEEKAKELNKIFIKNVQTKKPFVATKIATTLDGKIATQSGSSKWITSSLARDRVQKLRAEFDAILTGSGTVLMDDPSLACHSGGKSPIRIILDRNSKVPKSAKVFNDDGVKVYHISDFDNFDTLFKKLYQDGIYSVLVEAGSGINSALIKAGEVDFLYQFIAPKILGFGLSFADGIKFEDINSAYKIANLKIEEISPDILLTGNFVYKKRSASFGSFAQK